jgi:hypothetical protein
MSRRVRLLVVITAVLLSLGVAVVVAALFLLDRPKTISAATGPDGTWSVAVIARRHLLRCFSAATSLTMFNSTGMFLSHVGENGQPLWTVSLVLPETQGHKR